MQNRNCRQRVLIVGSDGVIGNHLLTQLKGDDIRVAGTTRQRKINKDKRFFLDLEQTSDFKSVLEFFDAVIICAGITRLMDCEKDPVRSRRINVSGTLNLVKASLALGVYTIFLSSNQVFSGKQAYPEEADLPDPKTEYGRQKVEVESVLLQFKSNIAILRMTKVLVPGTGHLAEWRQKLSAGLQIFPFADLKMAPISISDLINTLKFFLRNRIQGIYHLSGNRDITYAEAALVGARTMGVSQELISPLVIPQSIRQIAPRFAALNTLKISTVLKMKTPDVADVVKKYFIDEGHHDN